MRSDPPGRVPMNGPDGPPVGDRMVRAVRGVRAESHGRAQMAGAIERPDARRAFLLSAYRGREKRFS
jgi:hypothetical protein